MRKNGTLIVLEGTDGSGKATQFKKLVSRLKKERYRIATFDFPQYKKPSSYFVREYLNGRYGKHVDPRIASFFYALDRFDAGTELQELLNKKKIVIVNRYVASNIGHQGGKLQGKNREKFFTWLDELEYGILGIPRPDVTLILHVPAAIAQKLVDKKGAREYIGGVKRDLHEADLGHLKRAEETYLLMAKTFPHEFRLIECVERGKLLRVEDIHKKVWAAVRAYL